MKILLRSRRRKWAEIPFKINATLPLLYSAAANRDTEAVRAYMLDGGLFSRELLPYLRPMAGGYTLGLVCEVLVPPITDEAVSEFMPHVFSAKSISPVPLLDEDLVQLLNLVTNRPARIAWKHDPNAFEVRDLAGLVVLGAAAIIRGEIQQKRVDGLYIAMRRIVENQRGSGPKD